MIKEIRYKNFKALRDATLPLGRFTLIVGANGTGKTTAIQALEIAKNPRKVFWEDVASVGEQKPTSVSFQEVKEKKSNGFGFAVINWNANGESKGDFLKRTNVNPNTYTDSLTNIFENFKKFSFDAEKVSAPTLIKPNIEIEADGRNLSGVLLQLQTSEYERFEELNNEIQVWFPEFDRIIFEIPEDGKVSFLLRSTFGKHKIKAKDLSDGTRLALAYLTLAYLPNPPKIVAFEEPEKGIHPRLLENIQEAMYRLAYPENYGEKREPIQVIATTHSPYLLDLYKDYPEEIVIASKDENGVHFERLIDQPHYKEIIQDAPLGEVWYTGVLGGVPVQL